MTVPPRRSPHAQLSAMAQLWPSLEGQKTADGALIWRGAVQPKSQRYVIGIVWRAAAMTLPYVMVLSPKLKPRPGKTFDQIPHLIFDKNTPADSGLCLFDPDGHEWKPADLIAETTVKWAIEWLIYYELWHLTGEWLAPSVGYESVAEMNAAASRAAREAAELVHG